MQENSDIWAGVLGHESIKSGLVYALKTGKLHHALLFSGCAGVGKAMLARALVACVMCTQSDITAGRLMRCGKCSHCLRIASKTHPDVIDIEEKSATLKIDRIRELQSRLVYAPYEGGRRFVLIDDAHKMNDAAANCLLKTLEEPEGNTTFILISSQIQRLLPTIISRSQVLRFAPFDLESVERFLSKRGVMALQARTMAALSMGSLGRALDLVEAPESEEMLQIFDEILDMHSSMDVFSLAASLKGKKLIYEPLLLMLLMVLRDIQAFKAGLRRPATLVQYADSMALSAEHSSEGDISRAFQLVEDVYQALLGNANEVVAWERILLGCYRVIGKHKGFGTLRSSCI